MNGESQKRAKEDTAVWTTSHHGNIFLENRWAVALDPLTCLTDTQKVGSTRTSPVKESTKDIST